MLSSVFLPWLLLPFEANFHCGGSPSPLPSSCPAEGLVASQVSLWQVFTKQVPQTSNEPLTYIGMLPVGMALITLALGVRSAHRHVLLALDQLSQSFAKHLMVIHQKNAAFL